MLIIHICIEGESDENAYLTAVQTAILDGRKCLGMFNVNCDWSASPNMV